MSTSTPLTSGETENRRPILAAVTALWAEIQDRHPDVPDVALSWSTGGRRGKTTGLQHLHSGPWSGELIVHDELVTDPDELVSAVLHEAVHARAAATAVADTSRNGRFHNRKFADLAAEFGLIATDDANWGSAKTSLAPETVAAYEPFVATLRDALDQYVPPKPSSAPGGRGRNGVPVRCACPNPRTFRIAPSTLDEGPIWCGVCETRFAEVVADG